MQLAEKYNRYFQTAKRGELKFGAGIFCPWSFGKKLESLRMLNSDFFQAVKLC
jgi:hypothetical protein